MPNDALARIKVERDAVVDAHSRILGGYNDVRLSFWSFTLYRECPQKYIMHAVGRRDGPPKDSFYAIGGSVVHNLMEDFTKQVKKGAINWEDEDFLQDNMTDYYDQFIASEYVDWTHHGVAPGAYRKLALPEIRNSVSTVYSMLMREGLIPRDPALVHPEWSFKTPLIKGITITGRIDLVVEDADKIHIVDFKDVKDRNKVTWRQLVWYAEGAEPQFNKPVGSAAFLLTKLKDWSSRNVYGKTYKADLRKEIQEVALSIRRNTFKAKVDRHMCGYCPVKDLCPEWYSYSKRTQELLTIIPGLETGPISF